MSHHAPQPTPDERFLAAPAVYYCDLAHDAEPRLILAYFAELIRPPYRGLGLVARTELRQDELACMDMIGRRMLQRPFDYLHHECERVRHSAAPGGAIAALSASHCTALQIAPPRETSAPAGLEGPGLCTASAVLAGLGAMLERHEGPGGLGGPVTLESFCEGL